MTKAMPGGWENPSGGETERRHCFGRGCRGGGAGGISPNSLVRAPAVLLPALLNRTGRRESCPLAAESSKAHPKALAQAQAFPRVWRSNPGAWLPPSPSHHEGWMRRSAESTGFVIQSCFCKWRSTTVFPNTPICQPFRSVF